MLVSDQGVDTGRYSVIPRVLIFLKCEDHVLLLKGGPNKRLWANRFNGIGGHIEPGEDPLSAAYRELFEETGIADKDIYKASQNLELWLCGILVVNTGKNPGVCIFIFSGESVIGDLRASSEGSLHWVKINEIGSLPVVEDLPILLTRIGNMKRGDNPFSAYSKYENSNLVVKFFPEMD
jgi:8-oxo-dGTP diphosphatase